MEPDIQNGARGDPAAVRNGGAVTNGNATTRAADGEQPRYTQVSPAPREPPPLFPDSDPETDERDDNGSSRVASPAITSPPYWMTQGPNRDRSNVSAEDLPGVITLQDNEDDDGPGGSNVYGRDRNRACWARSVEVRDYVLVNGGPTNIGAFVVWHIRVETLNVRFRFSASCHPVNGLGTSDYFLANRLLTSF
jgi:hypothetical protein